MSQELIFVYNADSGLFNTVTDIAHKILSPKTCACNLCALTHGHFKVRDEWVGFLQTLDARSEFLYRDEFENKYGIKDVALPAIFRKRGNIPEVWIGANALTACDSLDELKGVESFD